MNLVCLDRDGTLIYDDKYYLGSQENWQDLIEFLPGVVEGIKKLKKLPDVRVYMITNQPGVAVKELELLTLERAHEVCREVIHRLEEKGSGLDGYFLCPHADPEYVHKKEWHFEGEMVCECDCIKPRLGMVKDALEDEGLALENVNVFVVGDRASDAQTAVNVGGTGVLVPFRKAKEEAEKADDEVLIAKSFSEVVSLIKARITG